MELFLTLLDLCREAFRALNMRFGILAAILGAVILPAAAIAGIVFALFQFT
jgi:hypothetical protein